MSIYLTDATSVDEIIQAKASGIVEAAKLYPAGATTNSEFGVTSVAKIDHILQVRYYYCNKFVEITGNKSGNVFVLNRQWHKWGYRSWCTER